jgi:hypothetical protein
LFPSSARGALGIAPGFVWGELLHGGGYRYEGLYNHLQLQNSNQLDMAAETPPPLLSSHSREKEKEEKK